MNVFDEMRNDIEVLYGGGECEYNVYSDMVDYIDEAETDYERLVDVLHEVETEAVYAYRCLQQDCATATNSSEHFFKKWWHAECELGRAKSENDKLRKYAEMYVGLVKAGGCDSCPYCDDFDTCRDMEVEPMSEGCALYIEMKELGIEVNNG